MVIKKSNKQKDFQEWALKQCIVAFETDRDSGPVFAQHGKVLQLSYVEPKRSESVAGRNPGGRGVQRRSSLGLPRRKRTLDLQLPYIQHISSKNIEGAMKALAV